jgi:hypothetical protein
MIYDQNVADDAAISMWKIRGAGASSPQGRTFFVGGNGGAALTAFPNGANSPSPSGAYQRSPAGSLKSPFLTIDYAIGQCVANRGDVILVLPGHIETITGAAGVALDVAGVSIVGLGVGALMGTFNFTTAAAASVDVTAASCAIYNMRAICLIDAQTAMFNITASTFWMIDCRNFLTNLMASSTTQATLGLLTNASASGMIIRRCLFTGDPGTAGTASAIRVVGGSNIRIDDTVCMGSYTGNRGAIDNSTTKVDGLFVSDCKLVNTLAGAGNTSAFAAQATTTGYFHRCLFGIQGTPAALPAAMNFGGNYVSVAGAAGTLT